MLELELAQHHLRVLVFFLKAADERKEAFLVYEDVPREGLVEKGQDLAGSFLMGGPGKAVGDLFERGAKPQQAHLVPLKKRQERLAQRLRPMAGIRADMLVQLLIHCAFISKAPLCTECGLAIRMP